MKTAYVYWIHLEEHTKVYDEGYVGVAISMKKRLIQHKSNAVNKNSTHLHKAINKYTWDKLVITILYKGEEQTCYSLEHLYRPKENIGWNIAVGGEYSGKLTKENNGFFGKTHTQEVKDKLSKLRKENLGLKSSKAKPANIYNKKGELIAENVSAAEWCREQGNISVSSLSVTTKTDYSKPSSTNNRHFYKGYRMEYTKQEIIPDIDFRGSTSAVIDAVIPDSKD